MAVSLVELTNTAASISTDEAKVYRWEFVCSACVTMSTMLTEAEAVAEMTGHVCAAVEK